MRCKKILLVNDNHHEIAEMEGAIGKINSGHSLYVATTGKDGIGMLMGSSSLHNTYSRNSKVQADIVFLKKDLGDMSGIEFLSIMRRYYSLKNIKVYLTTNAGDSIAADEAKSLGIAGVIEKPFDFTREGSPVLAELKAELAATNPQNAFLTIPAFIDLRENFTSTFLQVVKAKTALVTNAVGLKIAACALSVVMVSAVVRYTVGKQEPPKKTNTVTKTAQAKPGKYETKPPVVEIAETLKPAEVSAIPEAPKKEIKEPRKQKRNILTVKQAENPLAGWTPNIRVVRDTTIN
jgi:CheY-like chemotaxis protein